MPSYTEWKRIELPEVLDPNNRHVITGTLHTYSKANRFELRMLVPSWTEIDRTPNGRLYPLHLASDIGMRLVQLTGKCAVPPDWSEDGSSAGMLLVEAERDVLGETRSISLNQGNDVMVKLETIANATIYARRYLQVAH